MRATCVYMLIVCIGSVLLFNLGILKYYVYTPHTCDPLVKDNSISSKRMHVQYNFIRVVQKSTLSSLKV